MDLDLTDTDTWPDQTLYDLGQAVHTERVRRQREAADDQELLDTIETKQRANHTDGDPWVEPTNALTAYAYQAVVTHDGKTWISARAGASGEPGQSPDWREQQEPGQVVDWVPVHAGSEYAIGALVRFDGYVWRNDLGRPNGYQPGTTGSGWTQVEPA